MPGKHIVKVYVKDAFYHVYNRGVEKRVIFKDAQDHAVFLKYLKEALAKPTDRTKLAVGVTLKGGTFKGVPRQPKNFHQTIDLVCYVLMPNHFHFLVKQRDEHSLDAFVQSVCIRYSMYFNKRYRRVGKLFQGHYRAVLIEEESYLLHLTRYIHLNPKETNPNLVKGCSSYADFLHLRHTAWVKPEEILSFFTPTVLPFLKQRTKYRNFVEDYALPGDTVLGSLTLEDDTL